jgi:NAD(P)-dependent dehydrogenase (short-subunit alcohol dehydrogenase family)
LVQTRQIDPLDILGRTPIAISLKESLSYLRGKRIFITGAGGSIGSELARQLLSGGAERLYLFGHGENSICQIYRELRLLQSEGVGEKATIVPIIGDMKDKEYVDFIRDNESLLKDKDNPEEYEKMLEDAENLYKPQTESKVVPAENRVQHINNFPVSGLAVSCRLTIDDIESVSFKTEDKYYIITITLGD